MYAHRQELMLFIGTAALLFSTYATAASAAEPTGGRVTQFSPQGTVKKVRQVAVRFSDPMAPFGDPRAVPNPFEIECPEKGGGRWVDSRNWAYDFARDLPAGVRCTFRLRKGLKTLKGKPIRGPQSFTFSTGGPAIVRSEPYQGEESIEEEQAFVLTLDAEPTEASVLAHAWFRIAGIPNRVGARLVTGENRDAILQTFSKDARAQPIVILESRQRFPNEAKVSLVWGKGIATATGVATERDQVLDFTTRKAFTAQFYCQRENPAADCVPLKSMNVTFTAPVTWQRASQITLTGADGKRWTAQAEGDEPPTPDRFVSRVIFNGPFPESASFRIALPANLHDDAGRSLINAGEYPLTVHTAPFPPLAKFASRFGIIESQAGEPVLPVTLRNLEPDVQGNIGTLTGNLTRIPPERFDQILPWLRKVNRARRMTSVFSPERPPANPTPGAQPTALPALPVKPFVLPKPNGAQAFEVVGIPLTAPGLYVVELSSPRLGAALLPNKQPMYVPTAALVTNLSVHFKWAGENSLVWVTTLENAQPVRGAHVTIQDCQGSVVGKGETDEQGVARFTGLPARDALPRCYPTYDPADQKQRDDYDDSGQTRSLNALDEGLFVSAQTSDDLSFVSSGWNQGIEPWRFQLPPQSWQGPLQVHTIFDRPLFRAGETVHMKHILRRRSLDGFALVADAQRPTAVTVQHLGSNEKYELPLAWDAAGSAENTWAIPKEAKLGTYQVQFRQPGEPPRRHQWTSGSFRVEEFRVPLMKGVVRLPAEPQVAATEVPVDISVQYLAGGGAANLPVQLRAQIRAGSFRAPDEFERYTFGNGGVQEGIVRQGVNEEASTSAKPAVHQRQDLTLDAAGAARSSITKLPPADTLRELLAEIEFRDPNGEVQTVSSTVPLWPAKRLVGIKAENWAGAKDALEAKVGVVDTAGRAVAGAPVRVEVRQRKNYSHRKRLVGGFYAYENIEEVGPILGTLCEGQTSAAGWFLCSGKTPTHGNLILLASATDDAGHVSTAHTEVWVSGSDDEWFDATDSDRIDLLPEKLRYEAGETARFQVRMPFREATALVSSEREGILDAMVVHLSGKDPMIEVPVKEAFAPNMFISALVVRGRVGDVQPTAMVDLGKPAFKLGIAEIRVGWKGHELKVAVAAERPVYRVRERAAVHIAVRTADGKVPPAGSEVAVAAVDEGLLELQPNKSWDLLAAMMGRRGYGVRTATAHMQVVGKRHFGLKALPQGGGGGRQGTRELFDTLLLWQARVVLDADGNAAVEVPLNDSLTSFRIAAIATGGVGDFGTGTTTIRSTQDLMLLSGLAPLVREGDQFPAQFTVRNTTDHPMNVSLSGRAIGLPAPFAAQSADLAAGAAQVIGWDVIVPFGVDTLEYDVEARAASGASDHLRVTQQVRPVVPVRTFQATLAQLDQAIRQAVERPADALPDRGGIDVHLAPSLTGGLDSVRDWMRRYPYTCLEQRVSRAVALDDADVWRDVAAALPSFMDSDGLLKYFSTMREGSDVLTAYVLAICNEAGFMLPADVQEKMAVGLAKFVNGAIVRTLALRTVDLPVRKLAAIEALARIGKAQSAMLGSLTIEPNLWPTSAVLDWWSILQRLPAIPRHEVRLREAEQIIRARLNLQGTTMAFSGEGLWWLMVCPDTNAVRVVLDALPSVAWHEDMPRLLRGALGRQQRGHWDCTPSNAWGTLAVRKFAHAFEAAPVSGTVTAALGGSTQQTAWAQPPVGFGMDFPWPAARAELTLTQAGSGVPWATIQSRAAIPLRVPLSSGYQITKTVTPLEPKTPGVLSRGDVLRVRLEIAAQSDMTWVVVNDPIPAGASHLGTGLARDAQIATQTEQEEEEIWPAFQERAFDAYRAYYEFVPKGQFATEYTIRLNQSGRFALPTTRVEALYAPEMFGELPNAPLEVLP